ncbi:hypothetical protein BpHYR1_000356 [Brachionus plicatilis]|uniref:Uncharacterized protein n=1 Tax=Brachionus plicatilis TaxID=10195 RepID=A0A3M7RA02_BRAPC|nr:hypothetical protein BpHYR1_028431 [Brachionus plicatilis]RNA38759.1 hypothetical protein BpHYR1_000356 [Brachionus plicatilis]
MRRHATNQITI